jgi:Subtilase family
MVDRVPDRRPHIVVPTRARPEPFTSPAAGGAKFRTVPVNRDAHGKALKRQLALVQAEIDRRRALGVPPGVDAPRGFYLEFESAPGFLLKLESLEYARSGIELVATRHVDDRQLATVFVPQNRLSFFVARVEKYLTELHKKSGRPKNQDLVDSIAEVRLAVAESFWTDAPELLPQRDVVMWWEVWLRGSPAEVLDRFQRVARAASIEVSGEQQTFPERTVVLARASLKQFAGTLALLDVLAELRRVKQVGSYFMRLGRREQGEWPKDLLGRLQPPPITAPAATILDTGVNRAHPLLAPLLDAADVHTCRPAWGTSDHHGHGTEMAGIGAFGDLVSALLASGPIALDHRLESVKILPPTGDNPQHLYGRITADGVSLVEIQAPHRRRAFSLAITADGIDRGAPTAWSAEIDQLAAGVAAEVRRLFCVSAGNMHSAAGLNYPVENYTASVHDPGQSWNALTVGSYTEMTTIDEPQFGGWTCIAPPGGLSPTSTTSCIWQSQWPVKPDIVMEGGNKATSPARTQTDFTDSLSLLTTFHDPATRTFTSTGETSAAAARPHVTRR